MKEELGIKKIDDYYKYRVNIEKVKILKLNNVASFVKKYGYIENKYILIDWSKVAKIYDGIYISNEVIEKNKKYLFIQMSDVETLCVWCNYFLTIC